MTERRNVQLEEATGVVAVILKGRRKERIHLGLQHAGGEYYVPLTAEAARQAYNGLETSLRELGELSDGVEADANDKLATRRPLGSIFHDAVKIGLQRLETFVDDPRGGSGEVVEVLALIERALRVGQKLGAVVVEREVEVPPEREREIGISVLTVLEAIMSHTDQLLGKFEHARTEGDWPMLSTIEEGVQEIHDIVDVVRQSVIDVTIPDPDKQGPDDAMTFATIAASAEGLIQFLRRDDGSPIDVEFEKALTGIRDSARARAPRESGTFVAGPDSQPEHPGGWHPHPPPEEAP